MSDRYSTQTIGLTAPLIGAFLITPDDSQNLPSTTRQLRVSGTGGQVSVVWLDGTSTIEPVVTGDVFDWRIVRVLATGTTATGLRGYY
jgi:hypothetical protein